MSASGTQAATAEVRSLIRDARALGARLDARHAKVLLRLLDELAVWNRAYSLTSISSRAAMIHAHLLDSLSAVVDLSGKRIADVGTGAGFPGLPLAVVAPERSFTLIDSVGKKIRFVTHAVRKLELLNVTALNARVETLAPSEPFDTVMARAFGPLPHLLASVQELCGPSTRVVVLKGRYPRDELAALPRGWRLERARELSVPGLAAQRHILRLVLDAPAARLDGS